MKRTILNTTKLIQCHLNLKSENILKINENGTADGNM